MTMRSLTASSSRNELHRAQHLLARVADICFYGRNMLWDYGFHSRPAAALLVLAVFEEILELR